MSSKRKIQRNMIRKALKGEGPRDDGTLKTVQQMLHDSIAAEIAAAIIRTKAKVEKFGDAAISHVSDFEKIACAIKQGCPFELVRSKDGKTININITIPYEFSIRKRRVIIKYKGQNSPLRMLKKVGKAIKTGGDKICTAFRKRQEHAKE